LKQLKTLITTRKMAPTEPGIKELKQKKFYQRMSKVGALASVGVILTAAMGTAFLVPFAAACAISVASLAINSHFQRSNEEHADARTVELGANPLALITALRKIMAVRDQSIVAVYGELPKKGLLTRIWEDLNLSHPNVPSRAKKLAKLARKNGYSEEAIKAAIDGPITVAPDNNIPPDVIRIMMGR
jgi:Zn-dependent protease with chaperone function